MEREPLQYLVVSHRDGDSANGGFTLMASACRGTVRLRATGRRTLVADHHEHQLHIHLVLNRRLLRGNKSGSLAEFLDMDRRRRAKVVSGVVSRARLPPGCAESVERFCARAAACGRETLCDDVTVTVDWNCRPRAEVVVAEGDAGAERPWTASPWLPKTTIMRELIGCIKEGWMLLAACYVSFLLRACLLRASSQVIVALEEHQDVS